MIIIVIAIIISLIQKFENQYPTGYYTCMINSLLIDTMKTILLDIIITNTLIKHNNLAT
jgi:hypothetical protein